MTVSLVVPTYKERQNMEQLVLRAGAALLATGESFELIIVDDDSPDGTADEVTRLQATRPWLHLVVRKNQRDLSTAVLAGWQAAKGDCLGCMDGDLQHPPELVPELIKPLRAGAAEIVVASRYVPEGGVSEWKFRRRIISWTATVLARVLLTAKMRQVRDPMSGFFFLQRSVLDGATLTPRGYKILLEVLARGRYQCAVEVPYQFEERVRGGSKIGLNHVWQYLLQLLRIRLFPR